MLNETGKPQVIGGRKATDLKNKESRVAEVVIVMA
jgi:hypothetical protein